jgi:hypothetical protein
MKDKKLYRIAGSIDGRPGTSQALSISFIYSSAAGFDPYHGVKLSRHGSDANMPEQPGEAAGLAHPRERRFKLRPEVETNPGVARLPHRVSAGFKAARSRRSYYNGSEEAPGWPLQCSFRLGLLSFRMESGDPWHARNGVL